MLHAKSTYTIFVTCVICHIKCFALQVCFKSSSFVKLKQIPLYNKTTQDYTNMNNNEVVSYGQTRFKTILRKIKNDEEISEEDRQYVTKKKLQNKQKSIKNRIRLQQKEHHLTDEQKEEQKRYNRESVKRHREKEKELLKQYPTKKKNVQPKKHHFPTSYKNQ